MHQRVTRALRAAIWTRSSAARYRRTAYTHLAMIQRSKSEGPLRPRAQSSSVPSSNPSIASSRPVSRGSARPPSRPPSSASTRPSSSASVHPSPTTTPASHAPSSSSSHPRPSSSASTRPTSRATQRPGSRYSHRPPSRQASRILHLHQALVTHIIGLSPEDDPENFQTAVEFVTKNLDQNARPAPNVSMTMIDQHINGYGPVNRFFFW